jgi:hypothetical protein
MSGAYITTISRTNKYKFTLSFNILTRSQVDALEALIEEHGSSGLLYTDYLGAEWNVILEAHVVEYTEGSSFYTARLDLQGEPA